MATADVPSPDDVPGAPVVALSVLALLAGASGMAVSFTFLASRSHIDVIAGAAGFIAGTVLVATGLLALAVQSRATATSWVATHTAGCLAGVLPPVVAAVGWPALYFGAFLAVVVMPLVLIGCVAWAWVQSQSIAVHLTALAGWHPARGVRLAVFTAQAVAVFATWPLFGMFLNWLEALGYKVGWS